MKSSTLNRLTAIVLLSSTVAACANKEMPKNQELTSHFAEQGYAKTLSERGVESVIIGCNTGRYDSTGSAYIRFTWQYGATTLASGEHCSYGSAIQVSKTTGGMTVRSTERFSTELFDRLLIKVEVATNPKTDL